MKIDNLEDAKESIKIVCDDRREALKLLLVAMDQYVHGSLSPEEFNDYEKIKDILIKRHSQHEYL